MPLDTVTISESLPPQDQEEEYVHSVYNEIASHFSQTRFKPWPVVEKFLNEQPDFSLGLDVGCGNGKYLGVNPKLLIVGSDRSQGLIECAAELSKRQYNVAISDGLALPHPEGRFDFAISIAVIHHFSTKERRIEAIRHILSKLRSGGKLLVVCWALEQESSRRGYKKGGEQDVLIPWVLQNKSKATKSDTSTSDDQVSPNNETAETKYRYYHLYTEGELESDSKSIGCCTIKDSGYQKDNWWIILERT